MGSAIRRVHVGLWEARHALLTCMNQSAARRVEYYRGVSYITRVTTVIMELVPMSYMLMCTPKIYR